MKAKEIEGLDCGMDAGTGIRLVLRARLEEMCAFRAAALDSEDPQGVHDMRVASRRLRSLVKDFSPYFRRSRKLRQAKDDLKRLAEALGAVRDEDVAIKALEKLASETPPEVSPGVKRLADERRLRQERARPELEEALTEGALEELGEEFRLALGRGLRVTRGRREKGESQRSIAGLSFRQVGRESITTGLRELRDLSASLYRPLKTNPLHRMRLAAKRLRYSLELFDPCWNEDLRGFAKEIAKLQTSLGELHDCDLWIAGLGDALQDGAAEPLRATPEERRAAVWLLDYFVGERAEHFRAALARWHEWETRGFLARLAAVINDEAGAARPEGAT
jgi:CHAD domain-containing protein